MAPCPRIVPEKIVEGGMSRISQVSVSLAWLAHDRATSDRASINRAVVQCEAGGGIRGCHPRKGVSNLKWGGRSLSGAAPVASHSNAPSTPCRESGYSLQSPAWANLYQDFVSDYRFFCSPHISAITASA
ncbi:hypothetical protein ALQ94_100872 [Pseudomonas amygdali pv. morsprunorum]|uniref:Uncharacterized protein n=1 Tax=Pseudomonas amygdali pv. morsprunorum TaxID=129138 RepID=A0A3M2WIE0_PSEA0|nr:hypothetical protein ALQ94_100872 [Pseudomonas amygdali pv. morsprunorum]